MGNGVEITVFDVYTAPGEEPQEANEKALAK